jgi:hypothetical protein
MATLPPLSHFNSKGLKNQKGFLVNTGITMKIGIRYLYGENN